ncbi:flippase-like domain-containing protein, partial [Myxococcota bacterium]|nr:flippase-like domain-containing protein [Myxococcota bacterium]
MKPSKSQLFNIAAFLVGTGIIFYLIVFQIGWEKTQIHITEMGPAFLWLFPIYLITLIGDTFSWRLLIRKPVSLIRVMLVANSGTAINALTPSGDGGEFVKGNLIKQEIGGPESVSSLLLWNFLYAVTKKILAILGPILYLIFGPFSEDPVAVPTKIVWGFLIAGILTSIHLPLLYLLVKYYGVEKSAALFHKLPIIRRIDSEKFLGFARKIEEAFHAFAGAYFTRFLLAGLLLFIAHVSVCLEIWFVLKMLGMDISQ